jgi:hypothetical protein
MYTRLSILLRESRREIRTISCGIRSRDRVRALFLFFDRLMAMNLAPSAIFAMEVPCHMHSLCARSITWVFAECVCRANVDQIVRDPSHCERFFHCALSCERHRLPIYASQTWIISSLQGKRCIAGALPRKFTTDPVCENADDNDLVTL